MMIPDNETAVDMVYYDAVAETVAKVIKDTGDEALTVGVHGDWGAGKSSVLKMLESKFTDDEGTSVVSFMAGSFKASKMRKRSSSKRSSTGSSVKDRLPRRFAKPPNPCGSVSTG